MAHYDGRAQIVAGGTDLLLDIQQGNHPPVEALVDITKIDEWLALFIFLVTAIITGQLASALGGIRVERGSGSDEPLRAAADALEGGQLVALMPQGTIPRGEAFFDPVLKGRWGAARLAAMTRAPVIPIGLWGTEQVWPRSSRVPNITNVVRPPHVRVRVGEPVALDYADAQADTDRIMAAIMDLLPPQSRERHDPTPEELAKTLPPS